MWDPCPASEHFAFNSINKRIADKRASRLLAAVSAFQAKITHSYCWSGVASEQVRDRVPMAAVTSVFITAAVKIRTVRPLPVISMPSIRRIPASMVKPSCALAPLPLVGVSILNFSGIATARARTKAAEHAAFSYFLGIC